MTIAKHLDHCPVCHRPAKRTLRDLIAGHWDTAGNPCLGSYHSYDITISGRRWAQRRTAA